MSGYRRDYGPRGCLGPKALGRLFLAVLLLPMRMLRTR